MERRCVVDVVVEESASDVEGAPQQHAVQKQLQASLSPKQGVVQMQVEGGGESPVEPDCVLKCYNRPFFFVLYFCMFYSKCLTD